MSRELIGNNQEVVGSSSYFEKLHNAHFSGKLCCSRGDDFVRSMESLAGNRYRHLFKPNLEQIVRELERDLEQGLRDNDYIRDENADNLRAAIKQLERRGVRCYSLERMVDDLAWFVGGDAGKIRQLQQKLNELGIGERLKEDGVYGKKTLRVWSRFLHNLGHGTIPTLCWIDVLQSNRTGITIGSTKNGAKEGLNNAFKYNSHPYIPILELIRLIMGRGGSAEQRYPSTIIMLILTRCRTAIGYTIRFKDGIIIILYRTAHIMH